MTNKKKVLLIEDDPGQILMYNTKLQLEGFEALGAETGLEGINLAKKEKPNIIFLDIVMDEMDGVEVLRRLKKDPLTNAIPVIILTNLAKKETAKECLKLGALEYVIKTETSPKGVAEKAKEILGLEK